MEELPHSTLSFTREDVLQLRGQQRCHIDAERVALKGTSF